MILQCYVLSTRKRCNSFGLEVEVKEITLEATVDNILVVTDFVNEELDKVNCSEKVKAEIDVAIDELFGNIANYAYKDGIGMACVKLEIDNNPCKVIITFIDNGIEYNPLAKADPNITLSAKDRAIGGLGVYIVKNTMDEIEYEYKDGNNILRIEKNI